MTTMTKRGGPLLIAVVLFACGSKGNKEPTPTPTPTPTQQTTESSGTPEVALAAQPMKLSALDGPHADFAAFCKGVEDCEADDAGTPSKLGAPFSAMGFFSAGRMILGDCFLGVKIGDGWFFAKQAVSCGYSDTRTSMTAELSGAKLVGNVLDVRLKKSEFYSNMDNDGWENESETTVMVVCGVGKSGTPSCALIDIERKWETKKLREDADPEMKADKGHYKLTVTHAAGSVTLAGDSVPEDVQPKLGRHPLSFP